MERGGGYRGSYQQRGGGPWGAPQRRDENRRGPPPQQRERSAYQSYDADAPRIYKREVRTTPLHAYSQEEEKGKKLEPYKRPGHGTLGTPVDLIVNWYRLYPAIFKKEIHAYEVYFVELSQPGRRGRGGRMTGGTPEKSLPRARVPGVFWNAVRENPRIFRRYSDVIFDDRFFFWMQYDILRDAPTMKIRVPHPVQERLRLEMRITRKGSFGFNLDSEYEETVNHSRMFMKSLLTQKSRYVPSLRATKEEIDFSEQFANFGGGLFFIPRMHSAPEIYIAPGVRAWVGIYASIRRMENFDLVANFGLVHKLFYSLRMDLLTFYTEIVQEVSHQKDYSLEKLTPDEKRMLAMTDLQRRKFDRILKGCDLKSDKAPILNKQTKELHLGERHYRFLQLATVCATSYRDERGLSLQEFYYNNGIQLQYPNLPLAVVKNGKSENLVPLELLITNSTPQQYMNTLSFVTRMQISKKLSRPPEQHCRFTGKLIDKLSYALDDFLDTYEVRVDPKMVKCGGRRLAPPEMEDGDKGEKIVLDEDSNAFKLRKPFKADETPIHFVALKATDQVSDDDIRKFYRDIFAVCKDKGLPVCAAESQNPLFLADWPAGQDLRPLIDEMRHSFKQRTQAGDRAIVLFFTAMVDDRYSEIKYVMDVKFGEVSQVIDSNTVRKAFESGTLRVHHQIFLKLNAKLGGVNHILKKAASEAEDSSPVPGRPPGVPGHPDTMFIGIDVTHPSPNGKLEDVSLAAIVGSVDAHATRYVAQIMAQVRCYETVQQFSDKFAKLLFAYHKENGRYPLHVVVLRDGVSDSEMLRTASIELRSIMESWEQTTCGKDMPLFTYIVIQKRHTTRLYPGDIGKGDKDRNIQSGTVVDSGAVTPHLFDFYLASQHSELGTCRPAHYTVMYDEAGMDPDTIQEMCFNLCFVYARCTKPVSLPTPVYYAHHACDRARYHYLHAQEVGDLEHLRGKGETESDAEYMHRLEINRHRIEQQLQLNGDYPGMYWI